MSTYHIIQSTEGDWVALYKDGKLLDEGHSLSEGEVLRLLGIEYTFEERDLSDTGHAPEVLT